MQNEVDKTDAVMQREGYSSSAVILHGVLAISIFFLFVSSWWMLALPLPSDEFTYREFPFQLHKNLGMTLVVVVLLLLYVRFRHRPAPEESGAMRPWMRKLATVDHVILYSLIFAVCVSGYLSSSYSGWGTIVWWLIELPNWGYENEELNIFYSDVHLWTCWALLAAVAVHLSGALYHAFRNDGVVRRMLRL
jgi:cytochrome b561